MEKNSQQNSRPTKFIRLGIKAFIVRDGKILVVKERVKRNGEKVTIYDLPGGGIDPGENLQDALHREVMEEVGLKIEIGKPVGNWGFVIPSFEDPNFNVHIICMGYQCKLLGELAIDIDQNPAKQEDIFEALWMSKKEILALECDIFAHNVDVRKALEAVEI